jgi:acyl-CoA thioester hydrolase
MAATLRSDAATMSTTAEPTAFFFAPFVSSPMRIEPQWIDYNGHLNMAYYAVLADRAVEEAFQVIGLGADYAAERRASVFTAEAHVNYRRELTVGDPVRATVQLIDFDDKRIHVYVELRHAEEAWLSASIETMNLHVSMEDRRVTPFPPDILANVAIMKAAHSGLPRPEALGRVIGLPPRVRPGKPGLH